MKEHMFYRPTVPAGGDQMLMPGDVSTDENGGVRLDPKNQHLSCFAGGMFGIAGKMFGSDEDVDVGRRLTEGCLWGYENSPNGVMPEILYTLPCEDESCAWDEEKWLRAVEQAHADGDGGEAVDAHAVVQEKHLREGVTKIGDARYILR